MRRLVAALLLVGLPAPQAVAVFRACAPAASPYACAPRRCCCAKPVRPGRAPCHGGGAEGQARAEMTCHHPGAVEALPSIRPAVLEVPVAFGPDLSGVAETHLPERAPRRGFPRLFSLPPKPSLGRG